MGSDAVSGIDEKVVIVGCGPVGAGLAILLCDHGFDVTVIVKAASVAPMASLFPKASSLSAYWRNILDAVDCISDVPDDHSWVASEHHADDPKVHGYRPKTHRPNHHWRGTKADVFEAEAGYVKAKPRGAAFRRELADELARLEAFLKRR